MGVDWRRADRNRTWARQQTRTANSVGTDIVGPPPQFTACLPTPPTPTPFCYCLTNYPPTPCRHLPRQCLDCSGLLFIDYHNYPVPGLQFPGTEQADRFVVGCCCPVPDLPFPTSHCQPQLPTIRPFSLDRNRLVCFVLFGHLVG